MTRSGVQFLFFTAAMVALLLRWSNPNSDVNRSMSEFNSTSGFSVRSNHSLSDHLLRASSDLEGTHRSRSASPTSISCVESLDPATDAAEQRFTVLVEKLRLYKEMSAKLFVDNPQLEGILETMRWLQRMPESNFPEGRAQWSTAAKRSPAEGRKLFKLMHLMKPTVLLSMIDDPVHGKVMFESFKIAGLKCLIDSDWILDIPSLERVGTISFDGFRNELELREKTYLEEARRVEGTLSEPLTAALKDFMFAEMQKQAMEPYLQAYYDSFFEGPLLDVVVEVIAARREFQRVDKNLPLPSSLLAEYRCLLKDSAPLPKR